MREVCIIAKIFPNQIYSNKIYPILKIMTFFQKTKKNVSFCAKKAIYKRDTKKSLGRRVYTSLFSSLNYPLPGLCLSLFRIRRKTKKTTEKT